MSMENRGAVLRQMLSQQELLSAPGVYDLISARIAEDRGAKALYMTGYGTVASLLGLPDAGLIGYAEMVSRVAAISQRTSVPLIADADTGFGGLTALERTILGYERAGAAAIQIEDQEFPKRCGHTAGRTVVSTDDMVRRIQVAVDTRASSDFMIIARTDARTSLGLDEALRRSEAYAQAGADILFVEAPESLEELERVGKSSSLPLVANMVEGGKTPILPAKALQDLGFSLAIFPALGFLAAGQALREAYDQLISQGSSFGGDTPLYPFEEFHKLVGFDEVWDFEKRWGAI